MSFVAVICVTLCYFVIFLLQMFNFATCSFCSLASIEIILIILILILIIILIIIPPLMLKHSSSFNGNLYLFAKTEFFPHIQ
jgi:hypothetical protein